MESQTKTTQATRIESPTLRDLLAMAASEKDVEEIIVACFKAPATERIVKTRQQARYEHADRMLKARAEKP